MDPFRSIKQVLDFAIAREKEAHDFYVQLSGQSKRPETKQALEGFAFDELQHRIRLEAVEAGEVTLGDDEIESLRVVDGGDDIEPDGTMSYADLLRLAMRREEVAFRLYTNLASIVKDEPVRDLLLKLAQEEASHKLRLEIEHDWLTF